MKSEGGLGSITLMASKLQSAIRDATPPNFARTWASKKWALTLSYNRKLRVLSISEASHELSAVDILMDATWPERVQLDGPVIRKVVESYKENELLMLEAHDRHIVFRAGKASFQMPRLDSAEKAKVVVKPIPKNPRHKGKPEQVEKPYTGRPVLDATWDFSARMPLPQHQYPDSEPPPGQPPSMLRKICLGPISWRRLHQGLASHAIISESASDPPKPVSTDEWVTVSNEEKAKRWAETVAWMEANGCAAMLDSFAMADYFFAVPWG